MGTYKKKVFPKANVEARLNSIKAARKRRLEKEQEQKDYEYDKIEVKKKLRIKEVTPKNVKKVLVKLEKEIREQNKMANFRRSMVENEAAEAHERMAKNIGRYQDVIKKHFNIR